MNRTNETWTSWCEPGWSNVGQLHYPPTNPEICLVHIKSLNGIYVLGFLLTLILLPYSLYASRYLKQKKSKMICVCSCLYTFGCLVMCYARYSLPHEEEIFGRHPMKYMSFTFPFCSFMFWSTGYLFLSFYTSYLKQTSNGQYGRSTLSFQLAKLGNYVGFLFASLVTCTNFLVILGGEENITSKGTQSVVVLDIVIIFVTIVSWPLASFGVKSDLETILSQQHKPAGVEHRARRALRKIRLFTGLLVGIGLQSLASLLLRYLEPNYQRVFPYQVPFRMVVIAQCTLLSMIYVIVPIEQRISRIKLEDPKLNAGEASTKCRLFSSSVAPDTDREKETT